ncbi:MAG: hypothetical protein KAS23_15595, partial [Anaerohalosphaera sp.]|nr:hypothetical protein [Anaerohalosphaera sp.]
MNRSRSLSSVIFSRRSAVRSISILTFLLVLCLQAGPVHAGTWVPLDQAESTIIPSAAGDGMFCEIFTGVGGGTTPLPSHIATKTPNADLLSPRIDFPHPGSSIGIGNNFQTFFSDTINAPDAVKTLPIRNFILRGTALLKITQDLDLDTNAPGITVRLGLGSDDGFYLIAGDTYLGGAGDRGFGYSWYYVDFEDEGLYPLYFLFAANSVGSSGLELSWQVASGQAIIPQSNMYQSTLDCDNTVLFDEHTAGTYLTDQYAPQGMIVDVLSGDLQVTNVRPTEFVPVSSPMVFADSAVSPAEEGIVDFLFVDPVTLRPAVTSYFSCYVIDTETTGATLTAFGPEDEVLDTIQVNAGGASQQKVDFAFSNIRRIQVSLGTAEDTSALDNLCWASPSPLPMPDLTPTELTPPATAFADHDIPVSWTVNNIGFDPAAGTWTDRVYLSQDNTWDETDTLLGSLNQSGPVDPNQPYTKNLSVTLPDNLNGDYWIIIYTDQDNIVKEYTAESNNTLASPITLATDHTGAKITSHTPTGFIKTAVSYIDVTFDEAINPATFTAADVAMTNSAEETIEVSDPVDQGSNIFRIAFPEQSLPGFYTLIIGPDIEDLAGNLLDQNANSTPGEAEDVYTATFMLNPGQEQDVLMINIHGSSYDSSGYAIHQTLVNAGASSTYLNLSSNGQAAALLAANTYD